MTKTDTTFTVRKTSNASNYGSTGMKSDARCSIFTKGSVWGIFYGEDMIGTITRIGSGAVGWELNVGSFCKGGFTLEELKTRIRNGRWATRILSEIN